LGIIAGAILGDARARSMDEQAKKIEEYDQGMA
jgi:hypothetical protein